MSKSVRQVLEEIRAGRTQSVNEQETKFDSAKFYTKAEVDALLKKKTDLGHDHEVTDITDFEDGVEKFTEGKQ